MKATGRATLLAIALFLASGAAAGAQSSSSDSARVKEPEFKDLASFYESLPNPAPQTLDAAHALSLSAMPLTCVDHPHPRPNTPPYLWDATYTPVDSFETKRAFYGCYDWHSAVNSTWTLVKLLKLFPDLPTGPAIREQLNRHLGASNIAGEVEFFSKTSRFELPYGYAWLLRLQGELKSWDDPDARRWASNLQPLASLMSERMVAYLDTLERPVRVGVHSNTAMAMDNSLDYAIQFDAKLDTAIRKNATRLFARDINCNTASEPGPSDFASPCLYEAVIMGRLMERSAYLGWLDRFLPRIESVDFRPLTKTMGLEYARSENASVSATSHLVGLSIVRAMLMAKLANLLPEKDPRVPVLRRLAVVQAAFGLPQIGAVGYDGTHYYATWVTFYLVEMPGAVRPDQRAAR
ncbi:MAG TPA: DUF2891 family protein [Gemmatimonadaceae bacterium]|nr:DUF2891 family protein [Gemmatimonadaceae bacterium]